MKKYILLFFTFLIISESYSQNKNAGVVIYSQKYNLIGFADSNFYKLSFNNESSVYEEVKTDYISEKRLNDEEAKSEVLINPSKKNELFYYSNFKINKLFYNMVAFDNYLMVEDDIAKIGWELIDEFKIIGNFECQKARCKFRGRNYVAFFTNEIPVIYGPWKFNGLSGLILEVYEENYKIHIVAKEVNISKTDIVDFTKFKKMDFSQAIPYENLNEKVKELNVEFLTRLNSKLPQGVKPFKLDANCSDCGEDLEITK